MVYLVFLGSIKILELHQMIEDILNYMILTSCEYPIDVLMENSVGRLR
jgi:hypothetical protein